MKKITLIAAGLVLSLSTFAQTWTLDKVHSRIGFSVLHMGISEFQGSFKGADATITASKADFSDATVEFKADVNNISTDNEMRDKHLKSPDFFDAEKYGTLSFKSTSFKKTGDKTFEVKGDLTFHGVTKPITLTAVLVGTATNPQSKKELAGFKVTGSFKRADFGFAPGMPAGMLGEDVNLIANTEFVKG